MKLMSHERIDELYSLGIKVIQNPQVFSFSIDAVLLAYFTQPKMSQKAKIVDLCSGNGAVGMFISQKTHGQINEVEIQPKLTEMARRSIHLNGLDQQIKVTTADLKNVPQQIQPHSIDTITCNPPYYRNLSTTKESRNPYLAIAKHEIKTDLATVIKTISKLLKTHGHVFLVYPPSRLIELFNALQKYNLAPQKLQLAYSGIEQPAELALIDATKRGKITGLKVLPPIITRNASNNGYSQEMQQIMFKPWK